MVAPNSVWSNVGLFGYSVRERGCELVFCSYDDIGRWWVPLTPQPLLKNDEGLVYTNKGKHLWMEKHGPVCCSMAAPVWTVWNDYQKQP